LGSQLTPFISLGLIGLYIQFMFKKLNFNVKLVIVINCQ